MHNTKNYNVYLISWNLTNYTRVNFIMSKFKRRRFVLSSMTGAFFVLLNSITKKSFAPPPDSHVILQAFDKGWGVQIHWLWIAMSWIKPKSCSACS